MRSLVFALLLCPLLAASALAQDAGEPIEAQLARAQAEQRAAERESARLTAAAAEARDDADRLRAEQAAAARAIDAAEARITAADAQLRLAAVSLAAQRRRLEAEMRPVSSLLSGLALMAQRPPLLALADRGETDELVKVRILLDSTLPAVRARTGHLAAGLAEGQRLQQRALAARAELSRGRDELLARRERFAILEQQAMEQALLSSGRALSAGDAALAASEDLERLRGDRSSSHLAAAEARLLASAPPPPARPLPAEGKTARPALDYELPAAAPVEQGLGEVSDSGVRARGILLATPRGAAVFAPASGTVEFSGPFRNYDSVVIIDHGRGWTSLLVNVSSPLQPGSKVRIGDALGRALGPLQVELSHHGRRISPALIARSSQSLSMSRSGG
ncbi:MAG TPA: peptidoglycan DD-metalloendopeptidase family protein [Sphingomicrobium sp.]|nr:peptidoglycan DD-metalloendopeptidase family protein [Sphingomicrobium sp.]